MADNEGTFLLRCREHVFRFAEFIYLGFRIY